ncbi:hypothetical protein JW887_00095 [Candidatus Dojkabacteria bacterium]|nr:hypothetical protein [Candidatus Dojkabacteria bacterium]
MKKENPAISFSGILKAFPYALFMVLIVIVLLPSSIFLVHICCSTLNKFTNHIFDILQLPVQGLHQDLSLLINFSISLGLLVWLTFYMARFINIFGSKTILYLKNSKNFLTKKEFSLENPKRFMFEYTLKASPQNQKDAIAGLPPKDVIKYIKSVYPEWKYQPLWKPGARSQNFTETTALLNQLNFKKISKRKISFEESLRLSIENLDNQERYSVLLGPTSGPFFYSKPFYSIGEREDAKLFEGKRFRATIVYKGIKGFSLKLLAK